MFPDSDATVHPSAFLTVLHTIPDLGFQGTGTLTFKFLLREDFLDGVTSPTGQLCMDISFTMHKDGIFKLREQHGEGAVCFDVP